MEELLLTICYIDLDSLQNIIVIIASVYGVVKGVYEYENHVTRQKVQYLLDFGNKYVEDEQIGKVLDFLEKLEDDHMYGSDFFTENGTYKDEALSIHSIEMYMRFIEELELLIRSGSISESATLNLFGHYTTILHKYNTRWPKLKYNEKYWNVYRYFVNRAINFDYNNVTV